LTATIAPTGSPTVDPCIRAIASAVPAWNWSTEELLGHAGGRLSGRLTEMLGSLGVDNRHSILANYPDVLFGGAEPELGISGTALAVEAATRCLEKAGEPTESIGLVLGITSSPARLLPSLVCDLMAQMPQIPRSASTLSISYMGCSVIAHALEAARWYLTCNPGKLVLACFMEAITPLSPPLPGRYQHFSEIPVERRQETVDVMHGFLFGDGAVAMLLGAQGDGPTFGPVVALTNERAEDTELGTVPDGGSDDPVVVGRRLYTLSPEVSGRGVYYASHTVRELLAGDGSGLDDPKQAALLLMHTGSERILNGLCDEFGVDPGGEEVASSYRVLRRYGNTLGCSVPLMLAEETPRPGGEGLVMAFGLSFSCGAFSLKIPESGWTP
jgi:3-oxoacyl-[acyl-carrier-protein] synthase III